MPPLNVPPAPAPEPALRGAGWRGRVQLWGELLRIGGRLWAGARPQGRLHQGMQAKLANALAGHEAAWARIPARAQKTLRWYMVTTWYLGRLLTEFAGEAMTPARTERAAWLGALMGLIDFLTDETALGEGEILALVAGQAPGPGQPAAVVFAAVLGRLEAAMAPAEFAALRALVAEPLRWQLASRQQRAPGLGPQAIEEITFQKGGGSVVLAWAALMGTGGLAPALHGALMRLGAWIQYLNDAQDMRRDATEGTHTFVWHCGDVPGVGARLAACRAEACRTVWALGQPAVRTRRLLLHFTVMHWGVELQLRHFGRALPGPLTPEAVAAAPAAAFRVQVWTPGGLAWVWRQVAGA